MATLSRRIVWTAAGAAAAAALASMAVALAGSDWLVSREAERDARQRVAELVAEVDEEGVGDAELVHEIVEIEQGEYRAALIRHEIVLAGDPALLSAPTSGCGVLDLVPHRAIGCADVSRRRPDTRVVVAVPVSQLGAYRTTLGALGLAILLSVSLLSALAGAALSRWSLRPFQALHAALAQVEVAERIHLELPPPAGLDDVDALRTAIAQLLARLDAELSRTRSFAADAAHELRTPLSKILAELELMAEARPDDGELGAALGRMHKTATKLSSLVNQLLILASGVEGDAELVSVSDVAEEVVAELPSADRRRVRLDSGCDALVRGSRSLMLVALGNAIDNALKFSSDDVVATVREEADEVVVHVDDHGPGVDPALQERVFEHRYRAPAQHGREGHGIGLALVAHIADLHRGRAKMSSHAGGARAELRLPLHQPR